MADKLKREYQGELVGCSKCGRVIGADQVNTTGRCPDCAGVSPQVAKADSDKASDTATDKK